MQDETTFDVAVVGGGIMGCATALNLARAGLETVVLDRRGLCMEASGVNAGTLTHRTGPAAMQAYYTRAIRLWKSSPEWLGADVGFRERGGLTIGFTDKDAERIEAVYASRKDTEVEIEIVHGNRARELEPNLSDRVKLACWFAKDGYANSNRTGYGFHKALTRNGVSVRTGAEVLEIDSGDSGFSLHTRAGTLRARRIVIAAGAWVRKIVEMMGLEFTQTITCRVNMMNVMERMPRLFERIITHANGGLTLKQPDHGTILIGGGWQGLGSPQTGGVEIVRENLASNFRLTHSAFAGVADGRWVRGWLGIEARVATDDPIAGALPGVEGAFVVGCFHSGWTAGPYIGKLMADLIVGRDLELPLFDPGRVMRRKSDAAERVVES